MKVVDIGLVFIIIKASCRHRGSSFSYQCSSSSSTTSSDALTTSCECKDDDCQPTIKVGIFEAVHPLRQIEVILKNLFCSTVTIVKGIINNLYVELRTQLDSSYNLRDEAITSATKELEDAVILETRNSLSSLGEEINDMFDATSAILEEDVAANSAELLAAYTAYLNTAFGLATVQDTRLALISPTSGLFATIKSLVATLIDKNDIAVDKKAVAETASVDSEVKSHIQTLSTSISGLFKSFITDIRAALGTNLDALIRTSTDIVSRVRRALVAALDGNLLENFRLIEFLLCKCLQVISPGKASDISFPMFVQSNPDMNSLFPCSNVNNYRSETILN